MTSPEIWVYLDQTEGRIASASLGVLSEASRIAARRELKVFAVCCARESEANPLSEVAQRHGASRLIVMPMAGQSHDGVAVAALLTPLVKRRRPMLMLFPASVPGREVAARVSARTDSSLVNCASFFQWRNEQLVVTYPGLQEKVSLRGVNSGEDTLLATVANKIFSAQEVADKPAIELEMLAAAASVEIGPEVLQEVVNVAADMALNEVDIIVAGGIGVGDEFSLLRKLAKVLNGRLAASRMAVDQGWIDLDCLVGQTGSSVAPALYIACGISGAPQHLIGMRESETIIAINTDGKAPIGDVADLMLVGDLHQVIPKMIEMIETRKWQSTKVAGP